MRFILPAVLFGCAPVAPLSPLDDLLADLQRESIESRETAAERLIALGAAGVADLEAARTRARRVGDLELASRLDDVLQAIDDRRHIPMAVGDRWTYADGEKRIVFSVTGTSTIDANTCFAVERAMDGSTTVFHVSIDRSGLRLHQAGGHRFVPPFREVLFPLRMGREWLWAGRIGPAAAQIRIAHVGREEITVPAGIFLCHRLREESEGTTMVYLARDVGVVRLCGKESDVHNPDGAYFDWRLESFERR